MSGREDEAALEYRVYCWCQEIDTSDEEIHRHLKIKHRRSRHQIKSMGVHIRTVYDPDAVLGILRFSSPFVFVCLGKCFLLCLWLLRPSWLWTHRLSFPSPYVMRLQEPTAVEIMWCWQTQGLNYSRRALYWAKFWDEIIGLNVFSVRFDLSFPHPRTLFMYPFFSCGMESLFCDILYSKYINELLLFSRDIAMRFPDSQGQLLILTIENYLSC